MAALTVRMLEGIVRYEVGSKPGTSLELRELVNLAGEHLVAMAPWLWLQGRQLIIRTRPSITLTGATWTEATKTLTKIGAFAGYSFLSADTVEITGGTGATVGTYEVASKTSSDAIVLVTSIGAAANGQTNIEATLPNDQVAIPSDFDFQAITAYSLTNGLVGSFELTSAQGLLDLRTWPGLSSTISFWAIVNWVRGTSGGQPVPRLDIWPQTTDSEEQIVLFYRGGWKQPDTDTEILSIPNWLNGLFIEVVKAVVNGYEDPEEGSVDRRLTALRQSTMFIDAITRDALAQPTVGPMINTWAESERPDWRERFSLYRSPIV